MFHKTVVYDARPVGPHASHGIARYAYEWAKKITQHSQTVILVSPNSRLLTETWPATVRLVTLSRPWASLGGQWELTQELFRYRPERAYVPHFRFPFRIPIGTQLIPTLHDVTHLVQKSDFSWKERWFYKIFVQPIVQKIPLVLTVSEFSKQEIIRELQVTPECIQVSYNGCDLVKIEKNRLPISEKSFIFVIAQTKKYKNLDRFFTVYLKFFTHQYPLYVAGMTQEQLKARFCVDHPSIKALGVVSDQDLITLYRTCILFVYPSLYEGFGLPPLEALACGARILTSQNTVMEEILGPECDHVFYADTTDDEHFRKKFQEIMERTPPVTTWQPPRLYNWS